MKNPLSSWCNWWHTAYRKTRTEDPREDPRTLDRKKDPITEDPIEDPITKKPKVGSINEDHKESQERNEMNNF